MDHYLSVDNCYQRLEDEFKRYGKLIFCVDFDDTLYDYHHLGRKYDDVINLLHRWEKYSEVIILTGNGEDKYDEIKEYLDKHHIKYAGINCDSSVAVAGRKTYGNVYIDDRGGLPSTYAILEKLITKIERMEVICDKDRDAYEKYMAQFNAAKVRDDIVNWIRNWFCENGKCCKAVLGISGGKDSTVAAALCVEALGRNNVLGVIMPDGQQKDIRDAYAVVEYLGIDVVTFNIGSVTEAVRNGYTTATKSSKTFAQRMSDQAKINLAPRIRMSVLYAVSQSNNGRVVNTCNLSEDWVGYSTRYGDSVGDFSPLSRLTTDEVIEVGRALGLPRKFLLKVPADGLCDKTDEDNLGFTYKALNRYIRTGLCECPRIRQMIDSKHEKNLFKLQLMPVFEFDPNGQ